MKKLILSMAALAMTIIADGQPAALFNIYDSLKVNKLNYRCNVYGTAGTNYNKDPRWYGVDTRDKIMFYSCPWMSGYDAGNVLHVSSQTYNQERMFRYLDSATMRWKDIYSSNYWPGPLSGKGYQNYATSEKWAKIWKVSAYDIEAFLGLATLTTTSVPQAILTWPAKGNTHAQGNGGAMLTITEDMAPFVDANSNGIYEPLQGEYPDIKGDEALWWVYSDRGFSDSEQCANPMGVEVQQMVYAYNRDNLLDNAVYFDYKLINRSGNDYHDMRIANWHDMDLGWYYDDYIGFDSSRRLGIMYNGTDDDGQSGGHPVSSYGSKPPMVGCTLISMPGDAGTTYQPAGSFTYYNNDNSVIGNPATPQEYSNYLRSRRRDGMHVKNDYHGVGMQSDGFGAGPDCNYVFTGDPAYSIQWSECASNNVPGDRRFIIASNDFTFNAGATQHVVMAIIRTDSGDGGCPNASFAKIREVCDTVWSAHKNPPLQLYKRPVCCGPGTKAPTSWPNPATDKYYVNAEANTSISVYNSMGQSMKVPVIYNGTRYELDISGIPKGLYNAVCSGKDRSSLKFLKQ